MKIGIGLPNAVPGTEARIFTSWAEEAEQSGFSTLGVIDRLVYPNYEPITTLAAAAAVTDRIGLMTSILIPTIRNTAVLAKEAASLDVMSEGRFSLGVGLGSSPDNYPASGTSPRRKGARLDEQLDTLKRIWAGEQKGYAGSIGPEPYTEGGPSLIVGGYVEASFRRAARFGEGWIMGGGAPDQFAELAQKVDEAWADEGRSEMPRKLSLAYFSLGPNGRENADLYIHDYYGFMGDDVAAQIASSVALDDEMVRQHVASFSDAGCDELIMFPCSEGLEQVDLLAYAGLGQAIVS